MGLVEKVLEKNKEYKEELEKEIYDMNSIKKLNQEIQTYKDLIYKLLNDNKEKIINWKEQDFKKVMKYNENVERTTDIETFFAHLLNG